MVDVALVWASDVFEGAGGQESARGFETKGVNIRARKPEFLRTPDRRRGTLGGTFRPGAP